MLFLLGNAVENIRKISDQPAAPSAPAVATSSSKGAQSYQVKVDGVSYNVEVAEGGTEPSKK